MYLFFLLPQDDEELKTTIVAGSKSLLPSPVQELIKMIFDVESMKKTLVEFEVSTNNQQQFNIWCRKYITELTAQIIIIVKIKSAFKRRQLRPD